ncbi:MAG: DNRLRE domain-containing protein [Verrucomicrobiales bacterium]
MVAFALTPGAVGHAWESPLYDASWSPTPALEFETDKLVQDFSYAGYHRGERQIPDVEGPIFDAVSGFGADPTGATDSTTAIQQAIEAAAQAGGGVVLLPEGLFHVAPPPGESAALSIGTSGIVLRGEGEGRTFLVNTSTDMRGKRVVSVTGPSPYWFWNNGTSYPLTEDLLSPTKRLPVSNTAPFAVGDWIVVRNTITTDWVNEHNEPDWLGYENSMSGLAWSRQVVGIDEAAGELEIDVPTRYALKTRDSARVFIRNGALFEVGIEHLSIGNVQHEGSQWGESDFSDPATSAGQVHSSRLISFLNVRNGWIRNVASFQPEENGTSTCHMLSNGIVLRECRGITIRDCHLQRPQYGGGGGNGYMFLLQHTSDCLVENCVAEFNRHGLVFASMGSSGNVLRHCTDRTTGKATGSTGGYNTSGRASDHHMHFSHSNLVDNCTADDSWFTAHYRPYGTPPKHNLTSAHSVFWNTRCEGSPTGFAVHSQQSRYGYAIGTRGTVTAVRTTGLSSEKTNPVDHVEGVGQGDTLDPPSLSLDQWRRRLGFPDPDAGPDRNLYFPNAGLALSAATVAWGDAADPPAGASVGWRQVDGPASVVFDDPDRLSPEVAFPAPGVYALELVASLDSSLYDDFPDSEKSDQVTINVHPPGVSEVVLSPSDDAYVRDGAANVDDNFGTDSWLFMKEVGGTDYDREAYLKFDLGALAGLAIDSAELVLHSGETDLDATGALDHVADDAWSESTVTWANRPGPAVFRENWSPASDGVQRFDIGSLVAGEAATDEVVSLRLRIVSQTNSGTVFKFASKESPKADERPELRVRIREEFPSFADWMAGFADLSGEERGEEDDPESDRIGNLAEWIHALDPSRPSAPPLTTRIDGDNHQWLEFSLNGRLPGTAWLRIEASDTLDAGTWTLLPGVSFEMTGGPVAYSVRARLPTPPVGTTRRFYRLAYQNADD